MSEIKHSISEKMAQLDELLLWFDSDDFVLEEAADKFSEAKKMADAIEKELTAVKNTITVMSEQFDKD